MNGYKYNIGDTVIIDSNIKKYADMRFDAIEDIYHIKKDVVHDMIEYACMQATIVAQHCDGYVGYRLDIDSRRWSWHEDLLYPAVKRDCIDDML